MQHSVDAAIAAESRRSPEKRSKAGGRASPEPAPAVEAAAAAVVVVVVVDSPAGDAATVEEEGGEAAPSAAEGEGGEEQADVAVEVVFIEPEGDEEAVLVRSLLSDKAADNVSHGPVLELLPHGCAFPTAAEFTFDINPMIEDYQGEALFCVLRKDDLEGDLWQPLASNEGISISEQGLLTVEVCSFAQLMVLWMKGFDQTQALVDVLAAGLLGSGVIPDAAFRASFCLACVAAVEVARDWRGVLVGCKPEIETDLQARVATAVFADAERLEAEAAAAEEALRAENEAIAAEEARVAALPGQMKEAAKNGNTGLIEEILAEGVDINVVDEAGYTALYCATMYEKQETVSFLLGHGGATVDCYNNNGVSPLMAAARDGYTEIVKLLLAAGADVGQVDEFGRTADSVAEEKGFPETAAAVKEFADAHPVKE